jgi:4-amino-4-deoxychorismate lyase
MISPARPLVVAVLGRGIVDPDEPVIHADDVGLLRGLAVFETLRVYAGRPFGMAEHLARLSFSAGRLGLSNVPAAADLEALAGQALAAAAMPDCSLRFTLTGGRDDGSGPVAMVSVMALPAGLEELRQRGIALAALQLGVDPRLRRDAPWLLDGVKSTSYAVNMAAWAEARRRGADDALFVAADGSLLEGPVTNIWWRSGSTLCTPALDLGILAGVTRAHLLHLAGEAGLTVEEGWFPLARLLGADEAFTSSSVREIMPVVSVDERPLGDGRPGRAARDLQAALRRDAGEAAA